MRKQIILLIAAIVAVLFISNTASEDIKFESCMENPPFVTEKITMDPYPCKPGFNVTVVTEGRASMYLGFVY